MYKGVRNYLPKSAWRPGPTQPAVLYLCGRCIVEDSGGSKNFEGGRKTYQLRPRLSHMRTTQYMPFTRKKTAFWKKIWANRGGADPPPPLNPPLMEEEKEGMQVVIDGRERKRNRGGWNPGEYFSYRRLTPDHIPSFATLRRLCSRARRRNAENKTMRAECD